MSTTTDAAPRGTRQRLDHVDAMRPIKQSAVISTHALIYFSPLSTSLLAAGMLTLTHFSRDAFLFVSACMLAYSYRDSAVIKFAHYWKRRFMAVILVYLVWSVIYFPVAAMQGTTSFPYYRIPGSAIFSFAGLHNFLFALGTGYYHLYFLLVLVEFYVLFPYIFIFLRRFPKSHIYVLVGSIAWQFVYPYAVRHGWLGFTITPKLETRLVFSYPLYLLGGVIAAFYLEKFHDFVLKYKWWLLGGTVVFGVIPVLFDYLYRHHDGLPKVLAPGADPFAIAVIPYNVGAIVAVYLLGVFLVAPGRSERTRAITKSGSEAAYGIYLSQMIWIIFMHRWFYEWGWLPHLYWLFWMIIAVTTTYMVGWLFSAVFARTVIARGLVGRSQVSWSSFFPAKGRFAKDDHRDFGEGPLNLTDE
jgi:peptidoglycan/LPS O-acetylase OafA/YrhL